MGGIRIEGTSSNVADVTANNNLKVALPTTAAQVGSVRLMSENDDGSILGTPQLRSPETTIDYRLRVGVDTLLDSHYFQDQTFPNNKFRLAFQTSAVTSTAGYFVMNSNNTNIANTYVYMDTIHVFQAPAGNAPLYCETSFRISEIVNAYAEFNFGFSGQRDTFTTFTALDGAFFRLNSNGLYGVIKSNGTETLTGVLFSPSLNTTYQCCVVFGNKEVQFFVNDIMYCVPLTSGAAMPINIPGVRWFANFRQTGTGAASSRCYISNYNVFQGDVNVTYHPSVLAQIQGGGMYKLSTGTEQNYSISTVPSTATFTANTAPNINALFAYWVWPSSLTAGENDYPVIGWSPVDASNLQPHKSFVCTGIDIGDISILGAITGGPLILQWFVSFRCTGSSLATSEASLGWNASARSPRSIPMKTQVIAASAAAGTVIPGFRFDLSSSNLLINPDDYLHVYVRLLGTNITIGTMRQTASVLGYYV